MANHGGFKMSDLTMDDKLAYKEELKKLSKSGKEGKSNETKIKENHDKTDWYMLEELVSNKMINFPITK